MKIYMAGWLAGGLEFSEIPGQCFMSLEEAQRFLFPEGNGKWVKDDENDKMWFETSGWPRATVMELELQKPASVEISEGFLWRDFDDGWILGGEGPRSGNRICDLFPAHDGKRVRVTIEVLPDKPYSVE